MSRCRKIVILEKITASQVEKAPSLRYRLIENQFINLKYQHMENNNNDEERKRRAFMNALSNMYLFEESLWDEEQTDESAETPQDETKTETE